MTKEKVVERERTVVKGRAVVGGGDAFSIDSNRFSEIKKVIASPGMTKKRVVMEK
jgi:hypothetical protein